MFQPHEIECSMWLIPGVRSYSWLSLIFVRTLPLHLNCPVFLTPLWPIIMLMLFKSERRMVWLDNSLTFKVVATCFIVTYDIEYTNRIGTLAAHFIHVGFEMVMRCMVWSCYGLLCVGWPICSPDSHIGSSISRAWYFSLYPLIDRLKWIDF